MTKEIGGYFGLELINGKEYYSDSIRLNSGRYCLEYILLANEFTKIYLPYYTCEVLLEPIKKLNIEYEFYSIDATLNPVFEKLLSDNEAFLYINYFGIKQDCVQLLSLKIKNLIIDNSQGFFSKPEKNSSTFYCPRKFFGISDGAYLYSEQKLDTDFENDYSWDRMAHLLRRLDETAESGYNQFKECDDSLSNQTIKKMSKLTQAILSSINYDEIFKIRNENFNYIHSKLFKVNNLSIDVSNLLAPMVYPLWIENGEELKRKLIKNKVFVASYWENILPYVKPLSIESDLIKNLVPIPIDQRLNFEDLDKIVNLIL